MKKTIQTCTALACAIGAFLSMRWLTKSREDTRWEDADKPGKLVDIDGVRLHYIEAGKGDPIVWIHGFGGQTYSFRYQMAEFSRDYRCVAIDLKGFGYSERASGSYSLVEQARLVIGAMDRLGIDRCVLVGHSMGGEVVVRIAEMAPRRVEKLILVATAPGYPVWIGPRMPLAKPLMPAFARLARRNSLGRLFYDRNSVDFANIITQYEKPAHIYGSLNTVWEMWRDVRHHPKIDYSRVTMPVLVLWAEKERVLPFEARLLKWLRKRLPDAEVVTIPRTGHLLLEENPVAANEAIHHFIDEPGDAKDHKKTVGASRN